jgi:trimethylamine--corrinoid protein Co-methyltransferase
MQPSITLLGDELVKQILDEAFQLLITPGIKVQSPTARQLLEDAGALVDQEAEVAHIPEKLVYQALETVPHQFFLYDRDGDPKVNYGANAVHFDPGSSGVHILDSDTSEHRPSYTGDLVKIVKLTEMISQYDAQSTAVICNEIPKSISDLYRLYLVLLYSCKPIITGAFAIPTLQVMLDMLAIFAGSRKALAEKPQAVFDVCPSPPLIWSNFGAQNLIDLAHAGVPAQMVSMPLAGATAPVTLVGAVVQHAAECLSGITIHQLAKPGAPIVWGGAPAIFDMRKGTTPMGAVETAMIDASYTQLGKFLGLPTHSYLCASDAKVIDAQAGLESGIGAIIGALAGINMISGAGMLDFLACFSFEKLVIDAEIVAMAKRLLSGMRTPTETLATFMFEGINFKGDFLKQKSTRELFSKEQNLPSKVIDRDSIRGWHQEGSLDTLARAKIQVNQLLSQYNVPSLPQDKVQELRNLVKYQAREAGMDTLPALDQYSQ